MERPAPTERYIAVISVFYQHLAPTELIHFTNKFIP